MAFPTIPTVAAGRVLTNVQANTTATRTFPSLTDLTKNSGDLLIAICIAYQTGTGTDAAFSGWTAGWTEFADRATTTTMAIGAAYKWSTGSETGTISVTQAGAITGHAAMILMSIPGAHATTPPEASPKTNGTTAAADPAAFDPAGWAAEDTLWISVGGSGEDATTGSFTGIAGPPASYTDDVQTGISSDVVGGVEGAVAFRQLNAASENVGTRSVDVSNARNSALIIAVRPTPQVDIIKSGIAISDHFTGGGSAVVWNETGGASVSQMVASGIAAKFRTFERLGLGVIGVASEPYLQAVLADSPALYWRLDETSGTNANDQTANNRDGTYVGVTLDQTGLLQNDANKAVYIDNNEITTSYNPFSGNRTFEGLFTIDRNNHNGIFSGTSLTGNSSKVSLSYTSLSGGFYFTPDEGVATKVNWANTLTEGLAYHWVLTFNNTTFDAELYLNGVSQGVRNTASGWNASPGNIRYAMLLSDNFGRGWKGTWDEVAVYETILSSSRILAHYNAAAIMANGMLASGLKAATFTDSGLAISERIVSGPDVFNPIETGLAISPRVTSGVRARDVAPKAGSGISPFIASGPKQVERTYIKQAIAISNNFIGSGSDSFNPIETGIGVSSRVASGTDVFNANESGSGVSPFTALGVNANVFSDSGSGVSPFTGSGADASSFSENGSSVSARTGSGTDVVTFSESGAGIAVFSGSGIKILEGAPVIYTKSGMAIMPLTAAGLDAAIFSETGLANSIYTGSGSDIWTPSKTGSGISIFTGSGFSEKLSTKSGSAISPFIAIGQDIFEARKTGSGIIVFTGGGIAILQGAFDRPALIFPLSVDIHPHISSVQEDLITYGVSVEDTPVLSAAVDDVSLTSANVTDVIYVVEVSEGNYVVVLLDNKTTVTEEWFTD